MVILKLALLCRQLKGIFECIQRSHFSHNHKKSHSLLKRAAELVKGLRNLEIKKIQCQEPIKIKLKFLFFFAKSFRSARLTNIFNQRDLNFKRVFVLEGRKVANLKA
jgi:hypothetical protein